MTEIFHLETDDDPCITKDVWITCLLESRDYIIGRRVLRQFESHNINTDMFFRLPRRRFYCGRDMLFLYDELHDIPNGFQIFYRCLRETQDICRGHQILADDLEREARKSEWEVIKALVIFFGEQSEHTCIVE